MSFSQCLKGAIKAVQFAVKRKETEIRTKIEPDVQVIKTQIGGTFIYLEHQITRKTMSKPQVQMHALTHKRFTQPMQTKLKQSLLKYIAI